MKLFTLNPSYAAISLPTHPWAGKRSSVEQDTGMIALGAGGYC